MGTPGRIWYFMEQKRLGAACLHHVRFVIGDEADKLVRDEETINMKKFLLFLLFLLTITILTYTVVFISLNK